MQALESQEVRKFKKLGATLRAVILIGLVGGLAAIGAQAPRQPDRVTLNCAYDPAFTGTLTDAVPEIPGLCDRTVPAARRAPSHAVPDAASAVGTTSGDEIQPPTF